MLAADGLAGAFLGVGYRCGQPEIAIYSIPLAVDIMVLRDKISPEVAMEYIEFNCMGAWMGEETPIWLSPMTMDEYLETLEEAGRIINESYYSCESAHNKEEQEDGGEEAGADGKDIQKQ